MRKSTGREAALRNNTHLVNALEGHSETTGERGENCGTIGSHEINAMKSMFERKMAGDAMPRR